MHLNGDSQTRDGGNCIVVAGGKGPRHCWETKRLGIKVLAGSCNGSLADVGCPSRSRAERDVIRRRVVVDQSVVCPKLQRVFALDPGKVIDKVMYRDFQDGGTVFGG